MNGDVTVMNDLQHGAKFLSEIVTDLDQTVEEYEGPVEEPDYIAWAMIEEAAKTLSHVRAALTRKLASRWPKEFNEKLGYPIAVPVVIEGVGTFERHHKTDRTQWDKDALKSAVLDSRLIDPTTGEVADESPLDRILHVFNLPAPRLTALRARNIDPDDFCHSEDGGYSIEVQS